MIAQKRLRDRHSHTPRKRPGSEIAEILGAKTVEGIGERPRPAPFKNAAPRMSARGGTIAPGAAGAKPVGKA